ncbi:sulfurtransferase [Bizionia sp. M204]|uniref:sulfurtransferase n=1 Tax=unclassified Bizionia TaxID=2626393 RepID=UPI0020C1050D|nr:sulfurtransferase [Bizionia sp. M204]
MLLSPLKKPLVSVNWLHNHLDASNLIVLDATIPKVSELDDVVHKKEVIPNTLFFNLKQKFSDVSAPFPTTFPTLEQFQYEAQQLGIQQNSTLVVYDDKGIYSSARVWWLFKAFGFHNVAVLNGGLPAWKTAGFEVLNNYESVKSIGDFQAEKPQNHMVFFDDMQQNVQLNQRLVVDARSELRFKSLVREPRVGLRRGTIPSSVNIPYESLLDSGIMKSESELRTIFSKIAKPHDALTFSCGSGITACVLALGAELAGYHDLVIYDGSWTEWGSLIPE